MSNVVNFNKARKAKDQAAAREQASENRVKFGRTKGEKSATKAEAEKAERALDGAKRETD